jgi:hypothetical protein
MLGGKRYISECSTNANKTYFMLQHFFKNKNVSKKIKLILKNTIIDKTLTYASETWILTKRDRKQLNVFERNETLAFKLQTPVNHSEESIQDFNILTDRPTLIGSQIISEFGINKTKK